MSRAKPGPSRRLRSDMAFFRWYDLTEPPAAPAQMDFSSLSNTYADLAFSALRQERALKLGPGLIHLIKPTKYTLIVAPHLDHDGVQVDALQVDADVAMALQSAQPRLAVELGEVQAVVLHVLLQVVEPAGGLCLQQAASDALAELELAESVLHSHVECGNEVDGAVELLKCVMIETFSYHICYTKFGIPLPGEARPG